MRGHQSAASSETADESNFEASKQSTDTDDALLPPTMLQKANNILNGRECTSLSPVMDMAEATDSLAELESHCILRIPPDYAKTLRKILSKTSKKKIQDAISLEMNQDLKKGKLRIKKRTLNITVVDLPTIVESYKITDKSLVFKIADISQMMIGEKKNAAENAPPVKQAWPHGISPPLKNVRKNRFRTTIKNTYPPDAEDIQKEVKWLLQIDSEAVEVRWELIYDIPQGPANGVILERDVFGELSDTDDENSSA